MPTSSPSGAAWADPGGRRTVALRPTGVAMPGSDPQFITHADWEAIGALLLPLWMVLGAALGVALSFLTAHGIIPSLAASRDIPSRVAALRLPFYGAALAFLAFGLFSVWMLLDRLYIVSDIFWKGAH